MPRSALILISRRNEIAVILSRLSYVFKYLREIYFHLIVYCLEILFSELRNFSIIFGEPSARTSYSYITRFCTSQVHSLSRPSLSVPSFSFHSFSIVPPLSYYSLSVSSSFYMYFPLCLPLLHSLFSRSIFSAFCTARFLTRSSRTSLTADISPGHRIPRCLTHTIAS